MCYADDNLGMGVFLAFPKLSSPYFDIPSCLSTLNKWTNAHFLRMNESKTNILVFGNKNFNTSINMSTCLDSIGHITPLSWSTKLPGAHLDEDLSFDDPAPLSSKIRLSCPLDMLLIISSFQPLSAIGKKACSYLAPRFWNAIPWDIRILPTLDSFKAQLKYHLFTNFQSFLHAPTLTVNFPFLLYHYLYFYLKTPCLCLLS